MANGTCASAFIVWNNPCEIIEYEHDIHGEIIKNEDGSNKILKSTPSFLAKLTEQEVCDTVLNMWVNSKPGRIGAVTYCVSERGLHHLHMVLETTNSDTERFTYKQIQKLYGRQFHIEPTRGSKKEAEDYIYKRGKYTEKGEQVLAMAQYGEIKGSQGKRSDLEQIEEMIAGGSTPDEIFDVSMKYRRYKSLVKDAYYRKRVLETPFVREVKVIYHVGESFSGKSYVSKQLVEKYGEAALYLVSDYCNGYMDNYQGEPILFLDELRGESIGFNTLLTMLNVYRSPIHARYSNVVALWNEVHITSTIPPELLYNFMVTDKITKKYDSFAQLRNRIDTVVYHYKDNKGNYCTYEQSMTEYRDYHTLEGLALGTCDKHGFMKVSPDEEKRIKELFGKQYRL